MKKRVIIALSVLLLLSLCVTVALSMVLCGGGEVSYSYDYFAEDLSQYINLADSDYKGYKLTVKMTEVTDELVEEYIIRTLCAHASDEPKNPGKTAPLTIGDSLDVWYRSYIIDEDGKEIELDVGMGELGKSSVGDKTIVIGSGELPVGVESSLIGVVIADYPSMDEAGLKPGDVIGESDVLYISYSVITPAGKQYYTKVRVDLSRTDLDAEFGTGFRAAIVGKTVTEDGEIESFTVGGKDGKHVFENVRIDYAYPKDAKHITVSGTLPHGYSEYDLACLTVYYDIFPDYFDAYDTPALDAEFINETLKLTDEDLAEYEGADTVEKYRSYVRAELTRQHEEELRAIGEEAMWYHYNDVAEVIALPEDAVMEIYSGKIAEVELVWQSYRDEYPELDELACAYLSLEAGTDWRAKLKVDSEAEVKEKLIFYYIIRKENLIPTDEQYRELFDTLFDEFVVYYMDGKTEADYSSTDAYSAARAEAETAVMDYYGEEFFRHQVYYDYALDALLDFADIEIIH